MGCDFKTGISVTKILTNTLPFRIKFCTTEIIIPTLNRFAIQH